MNQTTVLTLAVAAGFAGGFVGSIFLAPAGSTGSTADDRGEVALYASEAEVRDLTERLQAVESATNSHQLSLGILEGRYEDLAERIPLGPAVPGEAEYGPAGDPQLAQGALPTGPGFDAAVAAVIEQREAAEQAEREADRERRREEARERRLNQLAGDLGLDETQKTKLGEVMSDMETKREEAFAAMRESGNWDRDQARVTMERLRNYEVESVSAFMTPDQVTKYQESATRNAFGGRGGQTGGAARGGRGGGF